MASALLSIGGKNTKRMSDACIWKYEGGQFCGGPFYITTCGEYMSTVIELYTICPNCGKPIEFVEVEE